VVGTGPANRDSRRRDEPSEWYLSVLGAGRPGASELGIVGGRRDGKTSRELSLYIKGVYVVAWCRRWGQQKSQCTGRVGDVVVGKMTEWKLVAGALEKMHVLA